MLALSIDRRQQQSIVCTDGETAGRVAAKMTDRVLAIEEERARVADLLHLVSYPPCCIA